MHIKIQDGTRSDGKSLCRTCQHSLVMKGAAESSEIVHCSYIQKPIRITVSQCSRYVDRNSPTLHDMYEIAWILETSKNKRSVGFTPWREYRRTHPNEAVPLSSPGF